MNNKIANGPSPTSQSNVTKITPEDSTIDYWKEIWRYRELIYFLCWRNLIVRYKQTAIGILWVIIRPILVMIALTLVFGKLAHLSTLSLTPYPLLVLAALLPWQLFSGTLADCSESLVTNANLVSKIYFPRLIIPISSSLVMLFDFFVTLLLLIPVMLYYGIYPQINVLFFPVFLILLYILAFGAGLWLSSFNVKFRDFRHAIPFILQFGLYTSPVGFTSSIMPEQWRALYGLNPLVGIIDGFRWSLLGGENKIYIPSFCISLCMIIIIFITGLNYFRKWERHLADII